MSQEATHKGSGKLTRSEFVHALYRAGVREGDVVYCQSQLYSFGPPEGVQGREELCEFYLDALREAVGTRGTIVIPTMSTHIGRSEEPYDPRSTPSNYGVLPKFAACHPAFLRSANPLVSVAAQGPLAEGICGTQSTSNFNLFSPFEQMVRRGAVNLYIGVPLIRAMQLIHYCEFVAGVPYVYNKTLDKRPVVDGIVSPKLVTSMVRSMAGEHRIDISRAVEIVEASGRLRCVDCGRSFVSSIQMADIVSLVTAQLDADPFFLLDRTVVYQYGDIPHDGIQDAALPPVQDEALKTRGRLETAMTRIAVHSPSLSTFLESLCVEAGDHSRPWVEHLLRLSDRGLFEIAWAFNEVVQQDGLQEPVHCVAQLLEQDSCSRSGLVDALLRFLDPHWNTSYNFMLGYFFAPFATSRRRSLGVGGALALHTALTTRFSIVASETLEYDASATDADLCSDLCLWRGWLPQEADLVTSLVDFSRCLERGGAMLAEIAVAEAVRPEDSRHMEAELRKAVTGTDLLVERVHVWGDGSALSGVFRAGLAPPEAS